MTPAQEFHELTGGCWHERDWSKAPTMWIVGIGTHCCTFCTCIKCRQSISVNFDSQRPTYSHADEILRRMKEFCGEDRFDLFMAQIEYGNNVYIEGIDWSGLIDVDYILNPSALLQKAIEFLRENKK